MTQDSLISEVTFETYAGEHYTNPCIDTDEFYEDLGRIKYIKRLLNKFRLSGDLKDRLIINHLVILYNVFESKPLTKMLMFKFEGYHDCLKPFLILLHRLPDVIEPYTEEFPTLYTSDIPSNPIIVHELRKILRNE